MNGNADCSQILVNPALQSIKFFPSQYLLDIGFKGLTLKPFPTLMNALPLRIKQGYPIVTILSKQVLETLCGLQCLRLDLVSQKLSGG